MSDPAPVSEPLHDAQKETVSVLLMNGVEGQSVYVNDYRVAGPKPWGGGQIVREWTAQRADLLRALGITEEATNG